MSPLELLRGWLFMPEANPAVVVLTLLPAVNIFTGLGEALGEPHGGNLGWGKFCDPASTYCWTSESGWTLAYVGAAAASAVSMIYFQATLGAGGMAGLFQHRHMLICGLLMLHWLKRLYEVKYVHRFHNGIESWLALTQTAVNMAVSLQFIYFTWSVPAAHYAGATLVPTPVLLRPIKGMPAQLPQPVAVGLSLWTAGELLSGYHHLLLAQLRADGAPAYAPPVGGLFSLVWCPHYLGEIMAWWGVAAMSQHVQPLVVVLAMTSFLAGRAWATRRWYAGRMGTAFPKHKRCLLPLLF